MLTEITIKNFKGLQNFHATLEPLQVIIGSNDCGKSTLLNAIAAVGRLLKGQQVAGVFEGDWIGPQLVWNHQVSNLVELIACGNSKGNKVEMTVQMQFAAAAQKMGTIKFEHTKVDGQSVVNNTPPPHVRMLQLQTSVLWANPAQSNVIRPVMSSFGQMIEADWRPDHLGMAVALTPGQSFQLGRTGFGLARLLDDLLGHDRQLFDTLEKEFTSLFPEFRQIRIKTETGFTDPTKTGAHASGKNIYLASSYGTFETPLSLASDGVRFVLGLLALKSLPDRPSQILIEEPDRGVYPFLLRQVVEVLKKITATGDTQVILTTHSPYMVDFFDPSQVLFMEKVKATGQIRGTRMSDDPEVAKALKHLQLGEVWSMKMEKIGSGSDGTAPSS